ncbi:MAG TPA: PAC2 family protein [Actinomycetota bacterium]|jgi:proteasome assembly chaperone (PAC2) family protein
MEHTTFLHRPTLRRPFLIAAFEGWNDAGEAASTALGFVGASLDAETFARIDAEEFYDFQQTRPTVRLDDDLRRRIDWPAVEFQAVRLPSAEHDLVLVRGHEPNLRWRAFVREALEIATSIDVEMVVTLGALLADVPHTRPVQVVGSAGDPRLARRFGLPLSRYEGPTGILGVLSDAASRDSVPALSLWAALPHYVQAAPNPRAALALVEKLSELVRLPVDTSTLADATKAFDETVAELISDDPDLVGYVERLEAAHDQESSPLTDVAPDQLVAEVERYLREQPGGGR